MGARVSRGSVSEVGSLDHASMIPPPPHLPLCPRLRSLTFLLNFSPLSPDLDFLAQSAIRLYENPTLPTHPITPPLQALPELSSFLLAMVTPTEMPLSSISLALLYLERLRAILPSTIRGGRGTAHRLALAALVLANKWNDDDSFGVRTWSKLVRRWFARGEVELMEAEMLARMSWRLFVPRDEWDEFLERLEDRLDLPLREAIGPELCNGNLVLDVMKMEDDLSEEEIVSEEIVEEEEEEEEEHVLMDEERMGNRVEDEGNDGKRQSTPPGLMVAAVQAKATLSWTPDANALGVIEGMVASREYAGQRLKDALRDATEKRVNSGRFSLPPQPSSAGSDTTAVDSVEQEPKEALSIHAMDSGIVGMDFRSKPY